MLADNFQTPAALGISDVDHAALVTVLRALERGDIKPESFHMGSHCHCICGYARKFSNGAAFNGIIVDSALRDLFLLGLRPTKVDDLSPAHAAMVLREYLVTGNPRWTGI